VHWLTDPFSFDFMQRALAAGVLAALTTSVVGTWVILRGLAFMGDALAHGVLPGIAVALLLDLNPVAGAAVAAVVMVAAISAVHRTTRLSEDTAIGLLFVGMLALGVIIISRSGSFAVDLVAVLFGDVLGTSLADLALQGVAAALGMVEVAAGLLLSYYLDTAAGATMSGLAVAVFFVVLVVTRWTSARPGRVAKAGEGDSLG
jgi:zinc/manganese transport system permease protein